MTHERNVTGLKASARQRSQATRQRAEEAINLLAREGRPINFKTVGEAAQVSTAWLYQQEDLKERILHLRTQQHPRPKVPIPQRERASEASKDAMIAALRERVKRLEEENRELRRQIEVAYGLLHQQT
jgi:Family of unknown function (DUF6262)